MADGGDVLKSANGFTVRVSNFAKQFGESMAGGVFSADDILIQAGLPVAQNLRMHDVNDIVEIGYAYDYLQRHLIDTLPEGAEPKNHVLVFRKAANGHYREARGRAFMADIVSVRQGIAEYTSHVKVANAPLIESSAVGLQWALINTAFKREMPIAFSQGLLIGGDGTAIERMHEKGRSVIKVDAFPEATAPVSSQG